MLKLNQNIYWELNLEDLDKLILEYFSLSYNFIETMSLVGLYYISDNIKIDVNSSSMEDCLKYYDSFNYINQALWLLVQRNILSEGKYIILLCNGIYF